MGAKNKLNASFISGVLIVAGAIALLTKSGTIFGVAVVALLITSVIAGDVRLSSRQRHSAVGNRPQSSLPRAAMVEGDPVFRTGPPPWPFLLALP